MTTSRRLRLTGDLDADELLSHDPLALLIGMLLDQQIPMEKAFRGPAVLAERLGGPLDAADIASYDPERFVAVMAGPPAVHRFPGSMAKRVQELCRVVAAEYDGDAAGLWATVGSGEELLGRLTALPGFGQQKAQIFLALLGKQLGVRPPGWRKAAGGYGADGVYHSIADVTDAASIARVREHKQAMKKATRG